MDTPVCIRKPSHPYVSGRSLRSCDQNQLTVHHTRLGPKGDGAFATGSRPLHTLPLSLASVDSLITLKEQLKLIFLNLYLCNFLFLCSNIILLWSTWWMDQWIDQFHFYKRLYVWFFLFLFLFFIYFQASDGSSSRDDLPAQLLRRNDQIRRLEAKLSGMMYNSSVSSWSEADFRSNLSSI